MSTTISARFVRFSKAMAFTVAVVVSLGIMLALIPNAGVADSLTRTSVVTVNQGSY